MYKRTEQGLKNNPPKRGGVIFVVEFNKTTYYDEYAPTIRATQTKNSLNGIIEMEDNADKYRARKITPSECLRLMGLKDDEISLLINSGLSNSQLYKMAGNSIVVDTLAAIFSQLFIGDSRKNKQLQIF